MGKQCSSCGVIKTLDAFDPIGKDPTKLQARCRWCTTKIWENVVGQRLESMEEIRRKNPDAYDKMVRATLFTNAHRRAKKVGLEFSITKTDIPLVHVCPVFGMPLTLNAGKQSNSSYSLDRIDSNLGYVPGNVRVISWRANYVKGNLTLQEAENLLLYMKGWL